MFRFIFASFILRRRTGTVVTIVEAEIRSESFRRSVWA